MQFVKQKGQRIHYGFYGVSVENSDKCWWCCNQWMSIEDAIATKRGYSNFAKVKTLRAFRRHLRKYGSKGVMYILASRFTGYGVAAYGRRKE